LGGCFYGVLRCSYNVHPFEITSISTVCLMAVFKDQVVVRLNMDGCQDSMVVADLGKDLSLVVDVEVVS